MKWQLAETAMPEGSVLLQRHTEMPLHSQHANQEETRDEVQVLEV